ncbi:MAG: galactokinase, partial [Deltaproteobacteria bacterium CG1_02_45_11]
MPVTLSNILESEHIEASAPCRIDMGGTLDISTFHYPLRHLSPCTFNMAVDLRTRVRILPYQEGMVRVSSKGFKSAEFTLDQAPFDHTLGLMFAIAAYFRAAGVHIVIDSTSPPRSALGGSSAAAVALIAAFSKIFEHTGASLLSRQKTAILAYALEGSVAQVPCGLQDQLAAAYGGVNAWYWRADHKGPLYRKKTVVRKNSHPDLERRLLVAYCGIPHTSKDINGLWIQQFISGKHRELWQEIVMLTRKFVDALAEKKYKDAARCMNREVAIRKKMTPDVLDTMGEKLVAVAIENNCGARFTGAGGGGCIW